MKPYPLLFNPVFKERIWGGTRLKAWFQDCNDAGYVGEAWILSDHEEGKSPVTNGLYSGKTLSEVIQLEPTWFPSSIQEFPLLFKVIDAAKDLSVQVHPDDTYAFEHAGEQGKTECWWVLDAAHDAKIVYGHNAQTREEFKQANEKDDWDRLLKYSSVSAGDFRFVPAGKVHALGAGTMVLEVQQSSDTTYRVYDYNRPGTDGKLRPLHLEDALNVIPFPDTPPAGGTGDSADVPVDGRIASDALVASEDTAAAGSLEAQAKGGSAAETKADAVLASCPYFRVDKWEVDGERTVHTNQVLVIAPVDNNAVLFAGSDSWTLERGHAALLPKGLELVLRGTFRLIVTTVPEK